MLILLAAATLSAGTPVAENPSMNAAKPARCEPVVADAAISGRSSVRKLGEMPPAQQIKAVWRLDENGCPRPLVVRAEVGTGGGR